MAKEERKDEAVKLYIREGKDISEISKILDISDATLYRWKKEDKENNNCWDEKRKIWQLSPAELEKVYLESVKELVLKVRENSDLMLDSKVADAMSKHISNLKKMNPRNIYLGVAVDLLTVIDDYLKKNDKKLRETISKHYESIKNELLKFIEIKQC